MTAEGGNEPADEDEAERTDIDAAAAERELQSPSGRRRKELFDLIRQTLPKDTRNYAVAPVLAQTLRAVFDGEGLSSHGGAPEVVGNLLVRLHSLLEALDAQVVLTSLNFASSVVVELEPVVPEAAMVQAAEMAESHPEGVLRRRDLAELIPTSVVASNAAVRLLETKSAANALAAARQYGSDVPDAYVSLARSVVKRNGILRVSGPGERKASLEVPAAERIITESRREQPLEPSELTIVGMLTRTDSEEERFRVVLDRERLPPELDGRKRVVEGPYTDQARRQVEENGLWNQRVIAKVLATPVKGATRAKPAFRTFEFTSLRRAAS